MDEKKLIDELKNDEGVVLHAYNDHLGFATIGVGRLIDKRKGGGISEQEADYLLSNDVVKIQKELKAYIPFYQDLDDVRQRALCNMCFQLGINGLLRFKKMIAAMNQENWEEARTQAIDSRWALQTPKRAAKVSYMILTGEKY